MYTLVRITRWAGKHHGPLTYAAVGTYTTANAAGAAIDLLCARPAPVGTVGWQVVCQATGAVLVHVQLP